jgi:type IV secretory pathway VirB10-like protein
MRLRAEPPRVTRLSRKVLAGVGLVASVGLGGALIYALQTRDGGRPNEELYSTENRSTADGLAGLPRDYSGVPRLGPPLPGDLGRPIVGAPRTAASPMPPPGIATPNAGHQPGGAAQASGDRDRADQPSLLRIGKPGRARCGGSCAGGTRRRADLASLGLAPPPATPSAQDRQNAFLNAAADRRTVAPARVALRRRRRISFRRAP